MKIKACEIKNFGKLCDRTVNLSDGITVIRGGNESGKSTLSAFIKYVLYGFSGKGRDERNNEKLRYTPWNGLKCSGALILEDAEHTLYRAERSSDGKTSKGKIVNSAGSICFEGYDAGEVFFGTDCSAFVKSSFVGQDDIEPDDMKDLGASLEKLLLKGDKDEADFEKASKTLNAEKNKLYNKMRSTGKIFELEEQLYNLRKKRIEESENNSRLNASEFAASETEKNLKITDERLEKLYEESENIEAYRAEALLSKIKDAHEEYTNAKNVYSDNAEKYNVNGFLPDREYLSGLESAHSEYLNMCPEYVAAQKETENVNLRYEAARAKLHEGNSFDESADTDDSEVRELFSKADALYSEMRKFRMLAIVFLCLVVTLPVSLIMFALYSKKKGQLAQLLEKYGFNSIKELEKYRAGYDEMYSALNNVRAEKESKSALLAVKKEKLDVCAERLSGFLAKYGYKCDFTGDDDYLYRIGSEIIPEIRIRVYELEQSYAALMGCKNAYEALISVSDVEHLKMLALKKKEEPPKRTKEDVDRAIKYDEGARAMLSKKLSEYKTDIARLGASVTDPADIESEIYRLEEELEQAKLHTDALELAIEIMEKSAQGIRGNVFPAISERAGELFSKFTGGKYRSLFFDKDFAIRVLESEDAETRKIGFLSSGAIDTAYIALRVALAEYLCKDKPTLVFDDSFAKIDDNRLSAMLGVLVSLADEYQIVILTCHKREEMILGDKCKTVVLGEDW